MKKNYQKPTTTATAITSEKMIATSSLTLHSDKRTGSQLGKEQDGGDWDNIWK